MNKKILISVWEYLSDLISVDIAPCKEKSARLTQTIIDKKKACNLKSQIAEKMLAYDSNRVEQVVSHTIN